MVTKRSALARRAARHDDLLQAKQTLSGRLLRAGLHGMIVAAARSLRVRDVVARAGSNVHAVGIGRKIVEDEETDKLCVRVYVLQKIARSLLPPRDQIPPSVDGIPTDVIESPPAYILARKSGGASALKAAAISCSSRRRKKQRPLVAGISVAHFAVTAGSLGYFCRSTRHGDDPAKVHVLSNNHVLADVNQGRAGDDLYQPGPADGGTANDHFADLFRFVPIQLGGMVANRLDAAIGTLRPNITYRAELCRIGRITGTLEGIEGMRVRKHGRTTGYTEGHITDDSYDALVGMDHNDPNAVGLFQNQLRIEAISPYVAIGLGGDSGSLVVKQDEPKAVGLYFAGPPSGVYGVANPIADVMSELEIELL